MSYMILGRDKSYENKYNIVDFTLDEMQPQIHETYHHRFLIKALASYDYTHNHYVLRPIDPASRLENLSQEAKLELFEILQSWYDKNYTITRNSPDYVTVPKKLHFHIVQFQKINSIGEVIVRP